MNTMNVLALIFSYLLVVVNGLRPAPRLSSSSSFTLVPVRNFRAVGGQRWGEDFAGFKGSTVLGPVTAFPHLGDGNDDANNDFVDDYGKRKQQNYNLNVGKALETLRRELPMVFAVSNLDFSIFANSISVTDGNGNTVAVQRSFYAAGVKSLRVAAALSSMYPSMNVKKIEYLEDCRSIACVVDVVLPDSVRVDGSSVWQGMFYFGLDKEGLINSHIFDRKISNFRPQPTTSTAAYPWLRAAPAWSADLISGGVARPPGLVTACDSDVEEVEVDAV
jgi:hypothetical protein